MAVGVLGLGERESPVDHGCKRCTAIARFKAAGCVSNTLDKYTAPGFTCTIGDMTFADFTWTPSDTTGGTAPPATSEMVVPDGLGFDLDGLFAASSGAIADAILHYTATTTDESNNIDCVMLLYAVGGQNGPGINGVDEMLCAGCLLAACPAGKLRAQRHRQWRCR